MSFPKFEHVRKQNPRLSRLLDSLWNYIRSQLDDGSDTIIPKLAAAALQINDGEAFVLLELLTQGGLLSRAYNIYCKRTGALLLTVPTLDGLDELLDCEECGNEHSADDLKLELAFRPIYEEFRDRVA